MEHAYETMRICVTAYLRHIARVEDTLSAIQEDIARIEARLELMGASLGDSGSGTDGRDRLPEGLARAAELRDRWEGEMAHHADDLAEAKGLCLPIYECRYILWLHIAERRTWDATARMAGYSTRQTHRMAQAGIRELYGLMPERWRREPIPNAAPQ